MTETTKRPTRRKTVQKSEDKPVQEIKTECGGKIVYRTRLPSEQLFSIPRVSGPAWRPVSRSNDGIVYFEIPATEAKLFERHWLFTSGKLVKSND